MYSVCDSHNVDVKVFIRSEILASHSGVYGDEQISRMFIIFVFVDII